MAWSDRFHAGETMESRIPVMIDLETDGLPVRVLTVAPNYDRTKDAKFYYRHRHQAYELHYVTKGSCELLAGERYLRIEAGYFCLLAPGVFHSQKNCTEGFDKFCISFEIRPDKRRQKGGLGESALRTLQAERAIMAEGRRLDTPIALLNREMELGSESGRKAAILLILLEMFRSITAVQEKSELAASDLDRQRSFLIDEFFNDNFNLPDGDTKLAGILGVSRRQLDRVLKKLYGMSYREKLREMRIEVAVDFLLTTNKSVAEISELMGYSSPGNFSAFIKTETGRSPSRLRQEARQKLQGWPETP